MIPTKRITTALVLLAVFTGCGGGGGKATDEMAVLVDPAPSKSARQLNQTEVDTLVILKAQLDITRDEYWDDAGGVLQNDWCTVWYPTGRTTVVHGMLAFQQLDAARNVTMERFGAVPQTPLTVYCSATMELYQQVTGRPWWCYSSMENDRFVLQPVFILFQRQLINIAIKHQYYRWAIHQLTDGRAPRWVEEGVASWLSDESAVLLMQLDEFPDAKVKMSIKEIDKALEEEKVKQATRFAYYNAYRMVARLNELHGADAIVEMVKALSQGENLDAACNAVFEKSYDEVVAESMTWEEVARQ